MGTIRKPEKAKLVIGLISADAGLLEKAIIVLAKMYGPTDFISGILPFNKTDYYEAEMGQDLKRQFISFGRFISPDRLPKIKLQTNALEFKLSKNKKRRRINLDPGYLNYGKLVLATTKDHQHRLYLGQGIFGEVTLKFSNGSFQPWEWTYPDYAGSDYIQVFNHIRQTYQQQLKNIS